MSIQGLKDLVDDLDFDLAFRRVKHDSESDFLQLPLEIKVFEYNYIENIQFLKETIQQETYIVQGLRKIWVPKRNYFLRPGSIPHLEDRIVFQALMDKIAPSLELQMLPIDEKVTFSHRLNPDAQNKSMYIYPKDLWLSFQKKAIEYCESTNIHYVLISDIASYFENIDLRLLNDTLISTGISPIYAGAIRQMLSSWANGRTRGLPQMIAPCSLLGNIYLNQVDKNMLMRGYNYIRYVDDIRIFVSTEIELRKSLLDLTEQLRNCYLDVQASKTKFYTALEHKNSLTLLEKHLVESGINVGEEASVPYQGISDNTQTITLLQSSDNQSANGEKKINHEDVIDNQEGDDLSEEISESKLIMFLQKLLNDATYDDRHLRFCINRLAKIKSPAALDIVLKKLYSMPQETETFVKYLLRLPSHLITTEKINSIIGFLASDSNIYDWQMMWLLIFLSKHNEINRPQLQRLYGIEKLQKHFVNRAILYYILCIKGDLMIQRDFMNRYRQEANKEVKMALLCGIYDLEKRERNRFYELTKEDRQTNTLIEMLKNQKVSFM